MTSWLGRPILGDAIGVTSRGCVPMMNSIYTDDVAIEIVFGIIQEYMCPYLMSQIVVFLSFLQMSVLSQNSPTMWDYPGASDYGKTREQARRCRGVLGLIDGDVDCLIQLMADTDAIIFKSAAVVAGMHYSPKRLEVIDVAIHATHVPCWREYFTPKGYQFMDNGPINGLEMVCDTVWFGTTRSQLKKTLAIYAIREGQKSMYHFLLLQTSTLHSTFFSCSAWVVFYSNDFDDHNIMHAIEDVVELDFTAVSDNSMDSVRCLNCPAIPRAFSGGSGFCSIVWDEQNALTDPFAVDARELWSDPVEYSLIWCWALQCYNPLCPYYSQYPAAEPVMFRAFDGHRLYYSQDHYPNVPITDQRF
ncbi:hypothetical protein D9758_016543 [Tetrapyrgos nigripes]|uniref:Uncharacterized protein n=1 Tax=Tetrapyrgos nigripes TaxID=182062 RepID=A0A8H5CB56_9AGAR|nr:hypothetical protein D9758_016543 [Tetrapyrgos nigripes]